jgi:hypothetical protein
MRLHLFRRLDNARACASEYVARGSAHDDEASLSLRRREGPPATGSGTDLIQWLIEREAHRAELDNHCRPLKQSELGSVDPAAFGEFARLNHPRPEP